MPAPLTYTIAEAARFLEINEYAVRCRLADGTLRSVGQGPFKRILIDGGDVRAFARRQQLGALGRRQRLVLVVGDLHDQARALLASGLLPERASGILDALSRHDVDGAPIIVTTPEVVDSELALLQPLLGQIHLAIVTHSQTTVPWPVELAAAIVDPFEPRYLVQWAWDALDQRTDAGRLKL